METIISIFLCFIILVPRASCSLSRRGLSTSTGPCAQALPVKETGDAGNENGALLAWTYDCDVGRLYWVELTFAKTSGTVIRDKETIGE